MINDKIDTWVFDPNVIPEYGQAVFILVESDVVEFFNGEPEADYEPFLEKAVLKKGEYHDYWELIDVADDDPEKEKILQQVYTVVAWRYVS